MLEQLHDAQSNPDQAWRQSVMLLEYKADLYGCHVKQVEPEWTAKECASCDVETAKSVWVREYPCIAWGFEYDRDSNAAMTVLKCGVSELGL